MNFYTGTKKKIWTKAIFACVLLEIEIQESNEV